MRRAAHSSGWVAWGMWPAPSMTSTRAAGTSVSELGDHGREELGALGAVRQQQGHGGRGQRRGVDRQGGRVGQLVEEGGGVGLHHRPERLRELLPRARPEGDVLDEVLGGVAVVPRADQVPHDGEVGVSGRQRTGECLIAGPLEEAPQRAARGRRPWRPGRGVR